MQSSPRLLVYLVLLPAIAWAACGIGDPGDGCEQGFVHEPTTEICVPCVVVVKPHPDSTVSDDDDPFSINIPCPEFARATFPTQSTTMSLDGAVLLPATEATSCKHYVYELIRDDDCPLEVFDGGRSVRLVPERVDLCKRQSCRLLAQLPTDGLVCHGVCHNRPELTIDIPPIDLREAQIVSPYPHTIRSCQQWRFLKFELDQHIATPAWFNRPTAPPSVHSFHWHAAINHTLVATYTAPTHTRGCSGRENLSATFRYSLAQCPTVHHQLEQTVTWDFEASSGPHFRSIASDRALYYQCQDNVQQANRVPRDVLNSCNEVIGSATAIVRHQADARRTTTSCVHNGRGSLSWQWTNPHCRSETLSQQVAFVVADQQPPMLTSPVPPALQTVECREQIHPLPDVLWATDNCLGNFSVRAVTTTTDTSQRGLANKYTERRVYTVGDGCNPARVIEASIVVNNDKPPRLTSAAPPALMTYQCAAHVPAPRTTLSNVVGNCQGRLDQEYNDYPQAGASGSRDDWSRRKEWIVRDQSGNSLRVEQTEVVKDTQAPVLYPNTTLLTRSCLWPPTGRYACFQNFSSSLNSKWEVDNCGEAHTVSIGTCQARDCTSADESACAQEVHERADGQPPCYYSRSHDVFCMRVERPRSNRARRYSVEPVAADRTGNASPWPLTFIVPGYGPGEEINPCEGHQRLQVPTQADLTVQTPFGSLIEKAQIVRTPAASGTARKRASSSSSTTTTTASTAAHANGLVSMLFVATVTLVALLL